MKMRDDSEISERIRYFIEILVPKYEKHFGTSLNGIFFWIHLELKIIQKRWRQQYSGYKRQ